MKIHSHAPVVLCILSAFLFCSCKKESFISSGDARLSASVDTLKYDTVFTTVGSVTQAFKISNLNNQKLRLNNVKLMGGSASAYQINVNGIAGPEVDGIEINADDSIYVFVTVKINPNEDSLPFIVRDSIQISFNGNTRFVQLEAFGQNAHFVRDGIILKDTSWTNELPIVILGFLYVDTAATLTIQKGCRIYSHADAPLIIDGSLKVNGTKEDSVVFSGDRTDPIYKDLPGGWPGIFFRESSHNSELVHAVIRNAYQAIASEGIASVPKVTLRQCIIDNAYDAGIICVNSNLEAENTLISNCGHDAILGSGGTYKLTHCTLAGYYNYFIDHKNPVLTITNYSEVDGVINSNDLNAAFINCIFWGDSGNPDDDEVVTAQKGNNPFEVSFTHSLFKVKKVPDSWTVDQTTKDLANGNPAFDSIDVNRNYYDFHTTNGPGVDKGTITAIPFDLEDKPRNAGLAPDLGCYENQ